LGVVGILGTSKDHKRGTDHTLPTYEIENLVITVLANCTLLT
jgi:hypothetical protein